jgi:Tol biopolymer transport system component
MRPYPGPYPAAPPPMPGRRPRPLRVLVVLALAVAFGVGVYAWLGSLRNTAALGGSAGDPTQSSALVDLPGTVVVAQGGGLYALHGGNFTRLASGGWMQPAVTPDHRHLVAVRRQTQYSDLYELSTSGAVERQLTNDAAKQVDLNHWSFYPSVSPDGGSVFYSYDHKYFTGSFLVDLSVYRQPLGGSQRQAQAWSTPNRGTGGDLTPLGVASSGGLLYTKSEIDGTTDQVFSQVWYQRGQGTRGVALSADGQRCQQPALSPGGSLVAMVCSAEGSPTAQLEVASLDLNGFTLGAPAVLASGLPAAPSWSPDGKSLLYFAPDSAGRYQLYTVAYPVKGAPAPKAVSAGDAFDTTSPPVWYP